MARRDWWERERDRMDQVATIETGTLPLDQEGKTRRWKYFVATEMRRNPTRSESVLWSRLRKREPGFLRQVVLYGYVADFYCGKARLIIEVDGPVHAEQRRRDRRRDEQMRARGFETLRFSNLLVTEYLSAVVEKIDAVVRERQVALAPKQAPQPQTHWEEVGRPKRQPLMRERGWVEVPRKRKR